MERFFKENDPDKNYAGLRRIGDPNDGTAVWTKVADNEVEAKLAERAAQRLEEDGRRDDFIREASSDGAQKYQLSTTKPGQIDSASGPETSEPASPVTPPKKTSSSTQLEAELQEMKKQMEQMKKANAGGCNCVVA